MDFDSALDAGKVAFLPQEGGDLESRTLTVYVAHRQDGERTIQRRRTEYEAIEPPRFLERPEAWWIPQGEEREEVAPSDLPLDVKTSERWDASETPPEALDATGLDTAGKALSTLEGVPPEEAARKDPEPPFTEGFEIVEEATEAPPGQSSTEIEEGPPEITSRTQLLREIQNGE